MEKQNLEKVIGAVQHDIMSLTGGNWSAMDVCMLVMDYDKEYGLSDIVGYLQFCDENPDYMESKLGNILHDLMGAHRKDIGFSPRTSGYSKHAITH